MTASNELESALLYDKARDLLRDDPAYCSAWRDLEHTSFLYRDALKRENKTVIQLRRDEAAGIPTSQALSTARRVRDSAHAKVDAIVQQFITTSSLKLTQEEIEGAVFS
jgi:hypothetical protein